MAGTAATMRGEPVSAAPWRDYLTLTKPRVMSLLLLTGACGMFVGERACRRRGVRRHHARPRLACGGASALNHARPRHRPGDEADDGRPVASGRVAPARALEFGLALSARRRSCCWRSVNPLTAAVALAGTCSTSRLHRLAEALDGQNIVIGGAAGAVPPLVGWAAATGRPDGGRALVLFVIVFVWTPPHFWALAMLIKRDYAAAGVPMLPVVRGDRRPPARS